MSMSMMDKMKKPQRKIESISDIIGDWGKWQNNIFLFELTISMFSAFNVLAVSFYAPKVKFHCANQTFAFTCFTSEGTKCESFIYDYEFGKSAVTEWNLVCDRSWLSSFSQSIYACGVVCSAITFSWLSDKYGRKPILFMSLVLEIGFGFACSFAPSIHWFIVFRFGLSMGCYGRTLTGFLVAMEAVGTKNRAFLGIAIQTGWAMGYCLLPGIAYLIKDFRSLILLMTQHRYQDAKDVLLEAMDTNQLPTDHFEDDFTQLQLKIENDAEKYQEEQSFFDLWKNKLLMIYSLLFYVAWFTNSFVYYGISLNIGYIGSNLYWSFFWAGAIEFPSYFFCMWAMKHIGRRPLFIIFMIGAGISCLGIVPLAMMKIDHYWTTTAFAMVGKFCITSSYAVVYIYTAEVYPTVVRQTGMGSCSVAARVGSVLAPFVKELSMYTNKGVAMAVFGGLSLITSISAVHLPETKDKDIPNRIEDVKKLKK